MRWLKRWRQRRRDKRDGVVWKYMYPTIKISGPPERGSAPGADDA